MRIDFLACSLLILFAAASAGASPAPGELFEQGKMQFETGRYQEAYDSFLQAFQEDPANPDYSFYLGRAAFEKGDYEMAVMAYDRVLIAAPDSPRVKLELARCHLELGSRELAKQYFKEVLATNPPENVWKNIQKFLEAIEAAERRHFLNGIVSAGVQYDTNVRVAPVESTIPVPRFDLPLTFAEDDDWAITNTAVLNHVYKFIDTSYSWKSSLVGYNAFHDAATDLDVNFLAFNTGPVRQTERYLWEAQVLLNHLDLGYDRYLSSYGLGSNLTLIIDEQLFFLLGLAAQEKNFYEDGGKDATNLTLSGGPVFNLGKNRVSTTFSLEVENADDDVNSYDRSNFIFRYDRLLPADVALFASFRFDHTKYDQMDRYFPKRRADELKEVAAGISKTLWWSTDKRRSLAAQLSHTHSENDSNIELYEYDRDITATVFTFAF